MAEEKKVEEKKEVKWYTGMFSTEDWWSFWLGTLFVILGIIAAFTQTPLTGWIIKFNTWVDIGKSISASHKELMSPIAALIVSYIIFTVLTAIGAYFMKWKVRDYVIAWTIIFILTTLAYIAGKNAWISAPSTKWEKFGLTSGLQLGGAYYIFALIIGLIIGNLAPKRFREFMLKAARPEWFIKIAIVALGAKLGMKAVEVPGYAMHLLVAGACATIAAYLLYWPIAYYITRRFFGFNRQWAACFASGISICGVSASIATAAATRAPAIIPVIISAIIVIFATIQLIIYPPLLTKFWFNEPISAGASLGLTIKTDGADAAAGELLDTFMRAKAEAMGIRWEEGWILSSAVLTKIWIDIFIGIWAFLLAVIWVRYFERRPGEKVPKIEIWLRFPKFILGYFLAMFLLMALGYSGALTLEQLEYGVKPVEGPLRHFFFLLTFMSIGIVTDFKKLKEAGIGKVALAYAIILFGIITPLGLFIAWVFHHGMTPPPAS